MGLESAWEIFFRTDTRRTLRHEEVSIFRPMMELTRPLFATGSTTHDWGELNRNDAKFNEWLKGASIDDLWDVYDYERIWDARKRNTIWGKIVAHERRRLTGSPTGYIDPTYSVPPDVEKMKDEQFRLWVAKANRSETNYVRENFNLNRIKMGHLEAREKDLPAPREERRGPATVPRPARQAGGLILRAPAILSFGMVSVGTGFQAVHMFMEHIDEPFSSLPPEVGIYAGIAAISALATWNWIRKGFKWEKKTEDERVSEGYRDWFGQQ